MTDFARRCAIESACVGAVVGLLGAIGWRYASRRLVILDNPPPTKPGDKGFMFTFDYLQYISGPRWWPALLLLPALGLVTGLVVGVVYWYALRSVVRPAARMATLALAAAATGAIVGAGTLILTHIDRPGVIVRIVNNSSHQESLNGPHTDPRRVEPWNLEIAPAGIWFPLIGALVAAILAVTVRAISRQAVPT